MAEEEVGGALAAAGGLPVDGTPSLRDPAAIGLPPATADGAAGPAGTLDVSAGRIRKEHLSELLHSAPFMGGVVLPLWWVVCALSSPGTPPPPPSPLHLPPFTITPHSP